MKLKSLGLSVLLVGLCCLGLMSDLRAQSKKAGQANKEVSCDGVLDVVPAKALTFARKRRPLGKPTEETTTAPGATNSAHQTTRKKSRS